MNEKTAITRKFEWDMGHRVTNHAGLCKNLHGHRYTALFTVSGEINTDPSSSDNGMVLDFSEMKSRLGEIIGELDHGFMIWKDDRLCNTLVRTETKIIAVDFVPTAENIANYLLKEGQVALPSLKLINVRVYETPNCYADAHL
jgi:6-pyruvoyltetrahydropterin/6-carboxytetrahydropterin synthase